MDRTITVILVIMVLIIPFSSCSSSKEGVSSADNSKVLAIVDHTKITKQQLDIRKKDSEFSQQGKDVSDSEVLERMIDEQLLLIKAKELKITMSDNEVKENYKIMLQQMSSKKYVEGDENKIDKEAIEALRKIFILQKTKDKLGSDIDKVLNQLRQKVKIKYYY